MSDIPWDDDELYNLEKHVPPEDPPTWTTNHGGAAQLDDGATPFAAGHGRARRFPTECLPPRMRAYVHDIAERKQVAVDLPALVMLGMIGAATAPRVMIRGSVEWVEPTSLYVACGMDSSAGKSPTVNELKAGAWRADDFLRNNHAVEVEQAIRDLTAKADDLQMRLNLNKVTIQLEERAGIESQIKAARAEVTRLATEPGRAPTLTLDGDTTPEALASKLALTGGQGAIVDDEGTLIANLGGQYSGGKTSNLGVFLKGYDCDSYRPSRVTRDAAPIERLALGLVLAPQPSFLADMIRNGTMKDSGFVNRFLFSLPGDLLGQRVGRKSTFIDNAVDDRPDRRHQNWWAELLDSIVRYPVIMTHRDLDAITVLDLSREAYDMHSGYVEDFEPRLRAGRGDLAKVANWAGKHGGRLLRLANGLHWAAGKTPDDRVDKETMANAIGIGEWAIEHFLGMGKVVGLTTGASQIKEYVNGIPAGWCTRTDINNKVFNKKGGAEDLTTWLSELVTTGEYVVEKLSSGRGRPVEIVRRSDAVVERG